MTSDFLSSIINDLKNEDTDVDIPDISETSGDRVDFYRKGDVNVEAGFGTWLKSMLEGETPLFNRRAYKNMKIILRNAGYSPPTGPLTATDENQWLTAQWTAQDKPVVNVQYRVPMYTTERKVKGEDRTFTTMGTRLSIEQEW